MYICALPIKRIPSVSWKLFPRYFYTVDNQKVFGVLQQWHTARVMLLSVIARLLLNSSIFFLAPIYGSMFQDYGKSKSLWEFLSI